MVIEINSVIGGFDWKDQAWLAASTVRLRCPITANCQITLSNNNSIDWLMKIKAANVPITFEETVMVMINPEIGVHIFTI